MSGRLLVAAALVWSVACAGSGGTGTPTAAARTPDPDIGELARFAAKANAATYTATYRSRPSPTGKILIATKYRRPPRDRQDFQVEGSDVIVSRFSLPDGRFSCERRDGAWSCKRESAAPESVETDPRRIAESLRKQPGRIDREIRRIAGVEATCFFSFSSDTKGTAPSLIGTCFSPEGVPLLLNTADLQLEATTFSQSVEGSVFDLPAPPG